MNYAKFDALGSSDEEEAKPRVVRKQATPISTEDETQVRRRRLDHTWEAEAEREFEATQADKEISSASADFIQKVQATASAEISQTTPAPTAEIVHTTASTTTSVAEETSLQSAPMHATTDTVNGASSSATTQVASSLRRLKQLDAATSGAIEQECGVALRSSDSFRLIMEHGSSALKKQTRVLIVMAGSTFLCEEPISEESSKATSSSKEAKSLDPGQAGSGDANALDDCQNTSTCSDQLEQTADLSEEGEPEYEDDFEEFDEDDEDESRVVAELCFFRAKPSRGGLARKLGAVPVLHITLSTSDGLKENLEFVGVHQRRYCVEEPGTDAIARNLRMSLLQVALDFVFHSSRTRYTKERLVLRERSACTEALESREAMLPQMAEQVRRANTKIQEVRIEFLAPRARLSGSAALKGRTFLILDEDVLKVAPAKESVSISRPVKGSFKGLNAGFLNTSKAKQSGLSTANLQANHFESVSSSSASNPPPKDLVGSLENSEGAKVLPEPSPTACSSVDLVRTEIDEGKPAIITDQSEKRQLLLGGVNVMSNMSSETKEFSKAVIPGCGNLAVSTIQEVEEDEEEPLDDPVPSSISDLANQLFGSGDDVSFNEHGILLDIDPSVDGSLGERTESTHTPSPKGTSLGGGALSERSEPATEDGQDIDSSHAPAVGIRLLQQRRRINDPGDSKDESDDLVNRWMKQRW